MARVFEDQIPALRTGLQEANLASALGLTTAMITAGDTVDILNTSIQGLKVFGDQKYAVTVRIPGAMRMSKAIGVLTDTAIGGNTDIASMRADFVALDPNLPAGQATEYGQRNWDSN